jgi:fructose-1,6-bisphosphatase/inositol monophosphatase family enzyme
MTTPLSTDDVLRMLQQVAADVIEPRFRDLSDDEIDEKNPGDYVTAADREAEEVITAALLQAYPQAVVLGEEAYADDPDLMSRYDAAEHAFTVDPVDGTKNFVHGSPDHAVMLSEVVAGRTERAWVWQPQHGTSYVAERGAGTWRNGERLTRPPAADPPQGVTSRRGWIGRRLGDLPPLELTWVCCGVDYPHLVEGDCDFIVYGKPKPWDHAPTSLLLTEAGGYVGDLDGEDYRPRLEQRFIVAAADHATFERVRPLVAQHA